MSILDREHTVAPPGFNRWLIPPAALAVHLSIGQVYAFSVFKIPLTEIIGIQKPVAGDWSQPALAWIFSLAIAFLGISAAVFGRWVEVNGPRKTMLAAACCFGGGFLISALGVAWHQLWVIYLGYGVLGGCGLGLGYISPVSTLVKWFPDRPGMATGMAIMGFGGGAFIGSNLSLTLMNAFKSATSTGVAQTWVVMGLIYFVFMIFGACIVRVPAADWKPAGYVPPETTHRLITRANVALEQAWRTPQFWLLWVVLCFNVTAGIGILEQASPMIQEMFPVQGNRGVGVAAAGAFVALQSLFSVSGLLAWSSFIREMFPAHGSHGVGAAAAGAFVALLSLFNMGGRFAWSSLSDIVGRKTVYVIYLLLGAILYCLIPVTAYAGRTELFVIVCALILSMYGGGFATIPAYLKDLFGAFQVGAIHGRLLTAWSVAGILGPLLVNHLRVYLQERGASGANLYAPTMYLMAGLLLIGFICNLLVRPVDEKHHLPSGQDLAKAAQTQSSPTSPQGAPIRPATSSRL
jgi:MFS family permease